MPDFTDNLKPAHDGTAILSKERSQSDVPVQELATHLLKRDDFLKRQEGVLRVMEKEPLFSKAKQQNLSRPERYHLGLARAKKLRRLADQHGWDVRNQEMMMYLMDDVSPYMVHHDMFITTIREQGNDKQREYWLPKAMNWEAIGCYAQYVRRVVLYI